MHTPRLKGSVAEIAHIDYGSPRALIVCGGAQMHCPVCGNEMAYLALAHGFLCLETDCGIELDLDPMDVEEILQPAGELVLV